MKVKYNAGVLKQQGAVEKLIHLDESFKFLRALSGMNSYQQWQIVVKFNIPFFYRYFYNHLSNYTKTIIRLRLVNIGEYSPRLRLGEYSPIFTSPSANNC